nr:ATP-binding protein [uncultured Capnocytophaga sp.]
MIILQDFSFGNFRSFKEIQTLSLSKAPLTSAKDMALESTHTFNYKDSAFLKTKAIYGANASGKSNVVKALDTFLKIVSDSVKDNKVLSLMNSFVSTETINQSAFFQMIFWIDEVRYRYGFEVKKGEITSEWLYGKEEKQELCYFIREDHAITEIDKTNFAEGVVYMNLAQQGGEGEEILLPTNLFLTVLASFGFGKISKRIISNLSSINIISGLSNPAMMSHAKEALGDARKKVFIINMLKKGDTSISDLELIELDEGIDFEKQKKSLLLVSKKDFLGDSSHRTFPFEKYESEGTRKLFELSPYIYEAVKEGRPLVIDEFDARFHPMLTKRIVQLFNSEENRQTQFIFVTHDTSLLSNNLLRRDQIEFVEKDKEGASHLYSLAQINGIRAEDSFEKDYIHGKYGAIPLVDFSELVTNS